MATGRLPSELLAGITSEDITEMLAYSNLEPWGPLADEFRSAQICATLANVNRDPKSRPKPWTAQDFSAALERIAEQREAQDKPILLDDPEAQTRLIMQRVFGRCDG